MMDDDGSRGPRNAQGRLREWWRVRYWPGVNVWPAESPLHAVLHNPGRSTVIGDGGLGDLADRLTGAQMSILRAHEVSRALLRMPRDGRNIVLAMYDVPPRERPRSDRAVAEAMGMSRLQVIKALERAYGWMAGELGLPI